MLMILKYSFSWLHSGETTTDDFLQSDLGNLQWFLKQGWCIYYLIVDPSLVLLGLHFKINIEVLCFIQVTIILFSYTIHRVGVDPEQQFQKYFKQE